MNTNIFLVSGLALVGLAGCANFDGNKTAFTGAWIVTEENSIANTSEAEQVSVDALPPKFRIATASASSTSIAVTLYNGKTLTERGATKEVDADRVAALRFWDEPSTGEPKPGGVIAGRETILYESTAKRPDGEISFQTWRDKETNIILKSIVGIYSSQIQGMVRRSIKVCTGIQYTAPPESAFQAP